jgi:hypothetical protein
MNSHQRRSWNRLFRKALRQLKSESRNSENEEVQAEAGPTTHKVITWFWRFWQVPVALAVAATLFGFYLAFLPPGISVEPYRTLDPSNPFTEVFTVHNDSAYALSDLRGGCYLLGVHLNVNGTKLEFHNIMFGLTKVASTLPSKDSATVQCTGYSEASGLENADMLIDIQFGARWWPGRHTIRHRFTAAKNSGGTIEWLHGYSPSFSKVPSVLEMPRPPIPAPPGW